MYSIITIVLLIILIATYSWHQNRRSNYNERTTAIPNEAILEAATFAGGCFWCTESDFEKTRGVAGAVSGYTGGPEKNPSYKDVSSGSTEHREAVTVYYDPTMVSYEQLLDVYWRHINPTDAGGQFGDRGFQYSTAVFYHSEEQRIAAEESIKVLDESGRLGSLIVTAVLPVSDFYLAEDYHQDYYKKKPVAYNYYRSGSGRDAYIKKTWGDELKKAQAHVGDGCEDYTCFVKPSNSELKSMLTPLQYQVTQKNDTETPFENEFWDNKEEGIYVDVLSGEPLFSSTDKFVSGTGWPSFTKPISDEFIVLKKDYKLIWPRIEVRSKLSDSHIGHVFNDGPKDQGGKRWCMNSAAMRFIPKEELTGVYSEFQSLFE